MYRKFYGLACTPFETSPDPYFYYPTPSHNEALALLTYGVQMKRGFVVVSGEVGTGKTLLVRCLLESLNQHKVACAFVYNPRLSIREFLIHVLHELGLKARTNAKIDLLFTLHDYLLARCRRMENTALVVDEAQLLSWELLEEIRLLTNLETSRHKLLQIVLVGQNELELRLNSWQLRQLKQRIAMRCQLKPLGLDDVRGYIAHRLGLAGAAAQRPAIYPDETIRTIHQLSGGIPRTINTICENALIVGYARQCVQITPEIVTEVGAELCLSTNVNPTPIKVESPEEVGTAGPGD
jgi:general secretion pathway protein A